MDAIGSVLLDAVYFNCKISSSSLVRMRLFRFLFLYVSIVIAFAIMNYASFNKNSTNYLISEQLNKRVDRYDFIDKQIDLATYRGNFNDAIPLSINEFKDIIQPVFIKLDSINRSIIVFKKIVDSLTCEMDSLSQLAEVIRADNINSFREEALIEYENRIDSLESYLALNDSTQMIIQGKYVELAELNYQYAAKRYELQTYILQHYGSFIAEDLNIRMHNDNKKLIAYEDSIQIKELDRFDVSRKIRTTVGLFHANRREAVSFWDFLYYSICVSTTVSFGDIVPNSNLSRLLAISELLICLVLVAVILNRIIKRIEEKEE